MWFWSLYYYNAWIKDLEKISRDLKEIVTSQIWASFLSSPSTHQPIRPSSVYSSVHPSIHPFVNHPSIHYPFIHPSVIHLFITQSIHPSAIFSSDHSSIHFSFSWDLWVECRSLNILPSSFFLQLLLGDLKALPGPGGSVLGRSYYSSPSWRFLERLHRDEWIQEPLWIQQ